MIIGSVPLYNIMAVVVLSFFSPERKNLDGATVKKTLKGIITNPIIIGILVGMAWSLLRLPLPQIAQKTVSSIGATATPLGLMAMGASFDFKKALGQKGPAVAASFLKLAGFGRPVPSFGGSYGIPAGKAGSHSDHAGFGYYSKLLCDGEKYGS